MASLDQNLVTTQWSILGAFGVAITLLLPKAEAFRRDYLDHGKQADFDDARRWHLIVTTVPILVLVGLLVLSVIGAHHAGLTFSGGQLSQDTALVVAPVLAQLGFILMIFYVAPPSPAVRTISLLPATKDSPASSFSVKSSGISVDNTSRGDLYLCWINQLGIPENPNSPRSVHLESGASKELNGYAGHAWLVSTSGGARVGVIVAAETPSRVTVDTETVDQGLRLLFEPGEWLPVPEPLLPSEKAWGQSLIAIDNQSDEALAIEWVDFDGQLVQCDAIPPKTVHNRETALGHHFLVSAADGVRIGMATAAGTPHLFYVTPDLLEQAHTRSSA